MTNATIQAKNPRYLSHLSWREVAALPKQEGVVILPVGANEQHGHHLPTLTDTLLVTSVLERSLARLPDEVCAWALPPLPYGKSNEHLAFPGTISLSAPTISAVLHDIADGVKRAGFRRLALINGHGGNVAVLDASVRDIHVATGLLCFCLHPSLYVDSSFASSEEEKRFGFHAGELETSLMLALAPALVQMDQAVRHFPAFPPVTAPLFFFGAASVAWTAGEWSASGVFGDATKGTAAQGEAMLEVTSARLAQLITEISRFEVPNITSPKI